MFNKILVSVLFSFLVLLGLAQPVHAEQPVRHQIVIAVKDAFKQLPPPEGVVYVAFDGKYTWARNTYGFKVYGGDQIELVRSTNWYPTAQEVASGIVAQRCDDYMDFFTFGDDKGNLFGGTQALDPEHIQSGVYCADTYLTVVNVPISSSTWYAAQTLAANKVDLVPMHKSDSIGMFISVILTALLSSIRGHKDENESGFFGNERAVVSITVVICIIMALVAIVVGASIVPTKEECWPVCQANSALGTVISLVLVAICNFICRHSEITHEDENGCCYELFGVQALSDERLDRLSIGGRCAYIDDARDSTQSIRAWWAAKHAHADDTMWVECNVHGTQRVDPAYEQCELCCAEHEETMFNDYNTHIMMVALPDACSVIDADNCEAYKIGALALNTDPAIEQAMMQWHLCLHAMYDVTTKQLPEPEPLESTDDYEDYDDGTCPHCGCMDCDCEGARQDAYMRSVERQERYLHHCLSCELGQDCRACIVSKPMPILVVIEGAEVQLVANMQAALAMQMEWGEHGLRVEIPEDQDDFIAAEPVRERSDDEDSIPF